MKTQKVKAIKVTYNRIRFVVNVKPYAATGNNYTITGKVIFANEGESVTDKVQKIYGKAASCSVLSQTTEAHTK